MSMNLSKEPSERPDGRAVVTYVASDETADADAILDLQLSPEAMSGHYVAYWVYGMPGVDFQIVDLRRLPPGLEVFIITKRHGWTGLNTIRYKGMVNDEWPVPEVSGERYMRTDDVLKVIEELLSNKPVSVEHLPSDVAELLKGSEDSGEGTEAEGTGGGSDPVPEVPAAPLVGTKGTAK